MVVGTKARSDSGSERRDQILAIAARLIARQGYSATTVRDIADEAGILSGSLYHHFASKEAMLQEILTGFMTRLLARCEQIDADADDPRAGIDALVDLSFETIGTEPAAVGLYQNEATFLATQSGFDFLRAGSERITAIWIGQLTEGQRAGLFSTTLDPTVVYRFIRDAVWSTVRWYRPGGRRDLNDLAEQFRTLLHGGLLVAPADED